MANDHLTIYQELQNLKASRKGVIQDYYEKIKASFSILQNNSSAIIKYTKKRSYKSATSYNNTNVSEISSFSSACNIITESNKISNSNGSLIFVVEGNA